MLFSIYAEDIGKSSPLGPRFLPNSARDRMKVLGDYPPDMIPVVEGGWRIPPRLKVYGDDRFLQLI